MNIKERAEAFDNWLREKVMPDSRQVKIEASGSTIYAVTQAGEAELPDGLLPEIHNTFFSYKNTTYEVLRDRSWSFAQQRFIEAPPRKGQAITTYTYRIYAQERR